MTDTTNAAKAKEIGRIFKEIIAVIFAGFGGFMLAMAMNSSQHAPASASGYFYGNVGVAGAFLNAKDESGHCYTIWLDGDSEWNFRRAKSAGITLKPCN